MVWHSLKLVYVQFKRPMLTLQEFPSIRMEKAKCTVFTIWLKESRLFYRENHLFLQPILSNWWIREVQWEIDLVQITGDGSKPEDYEAIARLDYAKFLESLPSASYHQLDANQLEVQPILDKILKH